MREVIQFGLLLNQHLENLLSKRQVSTRLTAYCPWWSGVRGYEIWNGQNEALGGMARRWVHRCRKETRSYANMPVRLADPDDALGIGTVHVVSWQAAYRGVVAQDYLDSLDPAQRGENWRRYLNGPPRTTSPFS